MVNSVADVEKLVDTLLISVGYFKNIPFFRSAGVEVIIGVWIAQQRVRHVSYLRVYTDIPVAGDAR